MKRRLSMVLGLIAVLFVSWAGLIRAQDDEQSTIESQLRERRLAHVEALRELVELTSELYAMGTVTFDEVVETKIALADAELQVATTAKQRLEALEESLQCEKVEQYTSVRVTSGSGRVDEELAARAARIQGEIRLLEEKKRQALSR